MALMGGVVCMSLASGAPSAAETTETVTAVRSLRPIQRRRPAGSALAEHQAPADTRREGPELHGDRWLADPEERQGRRARQGAGQRGRQERR